MVYPVYIIFGVLPSFVWLLFYLKKDSHPESNRMILKIFFYGMIAAIPAILLEMGIVGEMSRLNLSPILLSILSIFIGVALVEEFLKYLVVRGKVLRSSEFDEPIDVLLYMIIAALGFAASENILILFSLGPTFLLGEALSITAFRFLGATFLHVLSSGVLGFFLALSFFDLKNRGKFLLLGIALATLLHGIYNFAIIEVEGTLAFLIPILLLLSSAIFLAWGFKRLKKIKSVCKI